MIMAVDSSASVLNSLLENLRLDDPWVPPRSWDSFPSQGGASSHAPPHSSAAPYATSTVSVIYFLLISFFSSLFVRLVDNSVSFIIMKCRNQALLS